MREKTTDTVLDTQTTFDIFDAAEAQILKDPDFCVHLSPCLSDDANSYPLALQLLFLDNPPFVPLI
jgi:hypothetical protein